MANYCRAGIKSLRGTPLKRNGMTGGIEQERGMRWQKEVTTKEAWDDRRKWARKRHEWQEEMNKKKNKMTGGSEQESGWVDRRKWTRKRHEMTGGSEQERGMGWQEEVNKKEAWVDRRKWTRERHDRTGESEQERGMIWKEEVNKNGSGGSEQEGAMRLQGGIEQKLSIKLGWNWNFIEEESEQDFRYRKCKRKDRWMLKLHKK